MTTPFEGPDPLQERNPNVLAPSLNGDERVEHQAVGKPMSKEAASKKPSPRGKQKSSPRDKDSAKPPSAADLSSIHLDGEEDEAVPIFDTCDDIRKKINDHLKAPGISQASFCRELTELLPHGHVNPRQMTKFLAFKGPRAGGHSPAFYAAYVYFEKLRQQQGKKKSAKREKLEKAWAKHGGFPKEGSHNMHLTCMAGEAWRINYLGCVDIFSTTSRSSGSRGQILRKKPRK